VLLPLPLIPLLENPTEVPGLTVVGVRMPAPPAPVPEPPPLPVYPVKQDRF
jgi:hypothetical protein